MSCRKVVSRVLDNPITQAVSDVAAVATGNPELIPLINAGERTAGGVAGGESIGKAVGQGAIAGGEALAGQEVAGAVGIGEGNTAFNNALGITFDNPASLGLPDIGAAFNNAIGGTGGQTPAPGTLPSTAIGENAAGAGVNSAGQTVTAPTTSASTAPSSGGGFSAPSSILSGGDINSQFAQGLTQGNDLTSLTTPTGASFNSAIGAAGTDNIGAQTAAPASLPSTSGEKGISAFLPSKSDVGKTVLSSALPLAAAGFEASKGPSKLPGSATALQPSGAATAPLLAIEQQQATEAQTGQLTPSQQANIEQYVQDQQNLILQQLASEGVTNPQQDSRYISAMNDLQQKVLAQQNNYVQQAIGNATSAGGAAASNITSAANMQIQNDKEFQDALAAAFGALGGTVTQKAA